MRQLFLNLTFEQPFDYIYIFREFFVNSSRNNYLLISIFFLYLVKNNKQQ